jgi:hypothetical protein
MRLRLINPRSPSPTESLFRPSKALDFFLSMAARVLGDTSLYTPGKRMFLVPPLNLMLLAALVPAEVLV